MPLFRNVSTEALTTRRSSFRFKHDPIVYDEKGWQTLPAHAHYPTPPPSDATSSSSTPAQLITHLASCSLQISINKPSARRGKKADRIPRPRNSFICFRSEFYKLKKKNSGGHDQNEISKEAGRVWTLLTPEEKQPFEEMAKKEKEDHQRKYPTYSYAPGKEKKAAASKRKTLPKKELLSKKLSTIRRSSITTVEPIILPSLPHFSPSLEDFRSTLPTPSPKPESFTSESPEMLDLTYSDNEPCIEFNNFDWSSIPTPDSSSVRALPGNSDRKSELYDHPVRHPSYDAIPEVFSFRPSLSSEDTLMDKPFPNMPTPHDVLLFAHSTQNNMAFISSIPIAIHDDWDPVAISMSSQEGGYDYVDFGPSYGLDIPDDRCGMEIHLETEATKYAIPSTSPPEEAYAEMSEYFNFNYHG